MPFDSGNRQTTGRSRNQLPRNAIQQKRSGGLGRSTGIVTPPRITWWQKMLTIVKNSLREPSFVVPLLLIAFVVLFVRAYYVPSGSMIPTLQEGDRIFSLAKYLPNGHSYKRGDVVTFMAPAGSIYVKRVIGIGGDTVKISGDTVYVNDEPSPWQGRGTGAVQGTWQIADDEYFVMGDNRSNSQDSRYIGTVKADRMVSHVVAVYYPFNHATSLLNSEDTVIYLSVIAGGVAVIVLIMVVSSVRRSRRDE